MDDTWAAEIGQRIAEARKALPGKVTQKGLGDLIGRSAGLVGNYERGDRVPFQEIHAIAGATNRDVRWLLHGESYQDPLERIEGKLDDLIAAIAPTRPEGADTRTASGTAAPGGELGRRLAGSDSSEQSQQQPDSPEEHDDQRRTAA